MLGPDGLPRYIPGIKINREQADADQDRPHIAAHSNPQCWVLVEKSGMICIDSLGWGIIPEFKKDTTLFNARSEKLFEPASFWFSLNTNRCLLLADGVYEHQQRGGIKKKTPFYINLKDGSPLLIPAVYDSNNQRFSIITRSANEVFKEIHNSGPNKHRMPLLCTIEKALLWIQKGLGEKELTEFLNYLLPDQLLNYHTVYSIRGNKVRPDGLRENDFFNWSSAGRAEQPSLF